MSVDGVDGARGEAAGWLGAECSKEEAAEREDAEWSKEEAAGWEDAECSKGAFSEWVVIAKLSSSEKYFLPERKLCVVGCPSVAP